MIASWFRPRKPWGAGRMMVTLAGSLVFVVCAALVLLILLLRLPTMVFGFDDLGFGMILAVVGLMFVSPIVWLAWSSWAALLLSHHGGPNVRRRLPVLYAVLTFFGVGPVALVVAALMLGARSKPESTLMFPTTGDVLALGVALVATLGLSWVAFRFGSRVRAREEMHPQ